MTKPRISPHPFVIYKDWLVTPWDVCNIMLYPEIAEYTIRQESINHQYVKSDTISKLTERNLIELSSFCHYRPLIERLYVDIIFLQFLGIVIIMMRLDNNDQTFTIQINEEEINKIPVVPD